MILNFRNATFLEEDFYGGRVLVNGVEIREVWYIDTNAGQVKTYDIPDYGPYARLPTKKEIAVLMSADPSLELLDNRLLSRTVIGHIQLFRRDGTQAWPEITPPDFQ